MGSQTLTKLRQAIRRRLPIPRSWLFSYIYRWGGWFDGESRSGYGSSLAYTENLRAELPGLLASLGVRTLLDVPCGDFHWMSHVPLDLERYVGADIVRAIIRDNEQRHGRADRSFIVLDIVKTIPQPVDLILCRDCLFHFPFALALKSLRNFQASGSRYLLTTTFFDGINEPVKSGFFYRINLQEPPFNFPPPILSIRDSPEPQTRHLALWELSALPINHCVDL